MKKFNFKIVTFTMLALLFFTQDAMPNLSKIHPKIIKIPKEFVYQKKGVAKLQDKLFIVQERTLLPSGNLLCAIKEKSNGKEYLVFYQSKNKKQPWGELISLTDDKSLFLSNYAVSNDENTIIFTLTDKEENKKAQKNNICVKGKIFCFNVKTKVKKQINLKPDNGYSANFKKIDPETVDFVTKRASSNLLYIPAENFKTKDQWMNVFIFDANLIEKNLIKKILVPIGELDKDFYLLKNKTIVGYDKNDHKKIWIVKPDATQLKKITLNIPSKKDLHFQGFKLTGIRINSMDEKCSILLLSAEYKKDYKRKIINYLCKIKGHQANPYLEKESSEYCGRNPILLKPYAGCSLKNNSKFHPYDIRNKLSKNSLGYEHIIKGSYTGCAFKFPDILPLLKENYPICINGNSGCCGNKYSCDIYFYSKNGVYKSDIITLKKQLNLEQSLIFRDLYYINDKAVIELDKSIYPAHSKSIPVHTTYIVFGL